MQAIFIFFILMMAVFTLSILYTRHYLHNLFEQFVGSPLNSKAIGAYDLQVRATAPRALGGVPLVISLYWKARPCLFLRERLSHLNRLFRPKCTRRTLV